MRQQWRTSAVFSTSGPTMMPGVSQRNRIGMSKASHSCMKRAALSAPGLSMAPERCVGVVGDDAERPALDADEGGHHAEAEVRPQLEHRAGVGQRLDDRAHVVDAQPVLRNDAAQAALVGALPGVDRAPGSTRGTAWRRAPPRPRRRPRCRRRRSAPARAIGADLFRPEDAEPAALDHRRPAHADVRVRRRDHHVAAAEQRGVAGEAAARVDADQRHQAAQPAEEVEGHAVEAGDAGRVGVARDARRRPR